MTTFQNMYQLILEINKLKLIFTILGLPGSLCAFISTHAMLLDPAEVSVNLRQYRLLTIAFQVFDLVSPQSFHEAQSLHLRYSLSIALSTLSSCRYLHVPKTRFLVDGLYPFQGGNFTLKAPGFSWRTEQNRQILIFGHIPHWTQWSFHIVISLFIAWAGYYWFQKTHPLFADRM